MGGSQVLADYQEITLPLLVLAGAWVLFNAYKARRAARFSWHWHTSFRKRQLIDGTVTSGTLMRRMAGGTWQYRKPTEEEHDEAIIESAMRSL